MYAFEILKSSLLYPRALIMFAQTVPMKLYCDTSEYWLGAALYYIQPDKTYKPIAYARTTLSKNDLNNAQIQKEGTSIIFALSNH